MIRTPLWRQGSNTFSYASFQDFSWSKLRFSRTKIQSESEDGQMLNDHLSLLEKYSILISYLLKESSIILPGLSQIFLSQDFSRPENLFDHFLVFKLFPECVGTLGGMPLQYLDGRGSLCFHGLIFPLSIF